MADPWHWLWEDGGYILLEDGTHWILEESPSDTHEDSATGGWGAIAAMASIDALRNKRKLRLDDKERPERPKRISIMEKYGLVSQEMPEPDGPVTTNLLRQFLPKPPKTM